MSLNLSNRAPATLLCQALSSRAHTMTNSVTFDAEQPALLTNESWAEQQIFQLIQENVNAFMGKMGVDEQKEYLRLSKDLVEREQTLGNALTDLYNDLSQQMVDALDSALKSKTGTVINSRTTYLKTRIRQLPASQDDLPANDRLGNNVRIYKEDLGIREYERSITLLEAAYRNFGFTAYFSTEEQRASSISGNVISVKAFVAVARSVDIGTRISDYIEKEFKKRLSNPLFGLQSTKLLVALRDAYRTNESWSISEWEFNELKDWLFDTSVYWDLYQLDAGGEKIALPFFTRRFDTPDGSCVYSYFPDRPNGALRRHASRQEAVDSLQDQIRNDVGLAHFSWFMKAISLNNQEKLRAFIKPLKVNRDELAWHAKILYDLFASKTPNRQKLAVEKIGTDIRCLAHTLPIHQAWPIQSDLIRLARTNKLADQEAAVALATYLVSETLSMLLIPLPGGVTGLGKIMLVAMLGALVYQTWSAIAALRRGQQAELVQAVGDILDLLVGLRLQGAAAKLSARRTRQLMNALGNPNYALGTNGKPGLWFINDYTQIDPNYPSGVEQNPQGLFEKDNRSYIKLQVDNQTRFAQVTLEKISGRYQLDMHGSSSIQPYVTYSAKHDRWTLDPIDTRALNEAQLLQHMISPSELPLSPTACKRSLDVARVDRQDLLDIWFDRRRAPVALTQAIENQQLREGLTQLQAALRQSDGPLPPIADQVMPALLADLGTCTIKLYAPDGKTLLSSHAPVLAGNTQPLATIELRQDGRDRYLALAFGSPVGSLMQQVLQEHERLVPNSRLGKTGHSSEDQHLASRLLELRKKIATHLQAHQAAVYEALRDGQPRDHLNAKNSAARFAPTALSGQPTSDDLAIGLLRRRFPDLSRAMAADLLRRHPSLRDVGLYSFLEAPVREAIHKSLQQSIITEALNALSDPSGLGLNAHSEALFCNLLTLLPGWPSDVGVQVYQGSTDQTGRTIRRGSLLDTYGSEDADSFVMLVKSGTEYAGYRPDSGDLKTAAVGENSLLGATLRTLTETQRNELGLGRHDTAVLAQDVLEQARVQQAHLPEFLTQSRESPLSNQSISGLRILHKQVPDNADADGVHALSGRQYVTIDGGTYQVMLDRDASSAAGKVWRIVKPGDPVAMDAANVYNSSRLGASHAIRRNAANVWVSAIVGAPGGVRGERHDWSFFRQLADSASAALNQLRSPQRRVHSLFPSFDEGQINAFIQSLGNDIAGGLDRREAEYRNLSRELKAWRHANASESTSWAKLATDEIKRCWRRETGTSFTMPSGTSALPGLKADFSHVRELDLVSINWSDATDTFMGNFSNLERLSITHSKLDKLPTAIGNMSQLTTLNLSSNQIRLDVPSAEKLAGLTQLEHIDLSENPLGITPDFSGMSKLQTLDLSSTKIDQWPAGLLSQTNLKSLNLLNNKLRAVPETYLKPPADQLETIVRINNVTQLRGNDFPSQYWRKFESYWRNLHENHPDLIKDAIDSAFDSGNPRIERYQRLYPGKTLKQAREFLWSLPKGTVAAELDRLELEFHKLQTQLDAWAFSGGVRRQGYVRSGQLATNAVTWDDRNIALERILSCWRQETPQMLAKDGTPIGLELDLSGLRLPSLPDLDVDFSHVGSLKLNNMYLSVSPESFLTRYRHVRWLDLADNQLRDLPPALGEMHGLTRLYLQNNRIRLTPDTARILAERITLRGLVLQGNQQLGVTPDFSQMPDIRSIDLSGTGIETWPTGLAEQPLLDTIDLSANQITEIPDSVIAPTDALLPRSARLNNLTSVTGNPLSDQTLARVRRYAARLITAGLAEVGQPNRLVVTSTLNRPPALFRNRGDESFRRLTKGLDSAQVSARRSQWTTLREQQGADPFFDLLKRLEQLGTGQEDHRRRVWELIDAITENSSESEQLRKEIFDRAGEPACCDRAAFSFGNLETAVLVYRAQSQAMDQSQGKPLSALSRSLFRLHEVDKIASADILRSETIVNDPTVSEEAKRPHRLRLGEEVEIRLAYRYGLKDRLQLPGQPQRTAYTHMGGVTQGMLDSAYEKIVALDNSPEEFQALLSREFWQVYITNKYQAQFEAQRQPFQERLEALRDSLTAGLLSKAAYKEQTDSQQALLAIEEAELIQTLTRQILAE
ncbi:hypothetical protein E4P00_06640 [Pseudomonas sp. B329]|nr:hypothetical protein [Pseudomonas sp. B329]